MKRFAKIAGIVLLAAVLCITAIACQEPKTNFEKVCDNVSAMQQSLYVASDDDFSVKITTMKQEELFIADGKADNLVTLTVLSVIPKDASKLNSTFEYTLEGDKEKLTGSIAKSKLGISLNAKISDMDKIGTPVTLTLTEGENSYVFELKDMLSDYISGEEALKVAYEHFQTDIDDALSTDSFERESYVKLITHRDSTDGEYFWYVSFIKDKSDYWSAIVNPTTGEVVSSRKNTKAVD